MIMILKLLITLHLWFDIIDVSNTKHVKKVYQELMSVAWHLSGA